MSLKIKHILIIGILGVVLLPGLSQADVEDITGTALQPQAKVDLGYRGVSVHGKPARAAEYQSLQSSPTLGVDFFIPLEAFFLDLEGEYLSDDEYNVDAELNAKAQVRLNLRSQRMFHNLDHIPYDNGRAGERANRGPSTTAVDGSRPDSDVGVDPTSEDFGRKIYYTDHNTNDTYGLRIDLNEVKTRIKLPDYPAHFNLAYWRYEKQGEKQQRFVNHPDRSRGCAGCHLQSKTRSVDRVTEEIKASVDAHAGFVDMVVETLYRSFRDREEVLEDDFSSLGQLPHDEDPDSTLRETTLKVSTGQSGGLVGNASFTIGKRENKSDLTSEAPIRAEVDYTKTTADVNYTPNGQWALTLRYRHLDMDRDNSRELTTYAGAALDPGEIPVRAAIDTTRDWYETIINYRPARALTLKGELRREDIARDFSDSESWDLPKSEVMTSAKVGFYSRLLEKSALKINGWAAYKHSDDPAYGTSAENRKELFLAAQYAPQGQWGLSASASLLDEENGGRHVSQDGVVGYTGLEPIPGIINFDLDRERQQQTATLGGWMTPLDGVIVDFNYGFFRTAIDQDLLFGNAPDTADPELNFTLEDEGVDFRQTVQTLRVGATWHASDSIDCRLEGYHIRSKEYFSPDFHRDGLMYGKGLDFRGNYFAGIPGEMSSDELREINKVDIAQNGIRGRLNWQVDGNWSCSAEASFDDYDERGNDLFDGSVLSTMVSLTRNW